MQILKIVKFNVYALCSSSSSSISPPRAFVHQTEKNMRLREIDAIQRDDQMEMLQHYHWGWNRQAGRHQPPSHTHTQQPQQYRSKYFKYVDAWFLVNSGVCVCECGLNCGLRVYSLKVYMTTYYIEICVRFARINLWTTEDSHPSMCGARK